MRVSLFAGPESDTALPRLLMNILMCLRLGFRGWGKKKRRRTWKSRSKTNNMELFGHMCGWFSLGSCLLILCSLICRIPLSRCSLFSVVHLSSLASNSWMFVAITAAASNPLKILML